MKSHSHLGQNFITETKLIKKIIELSKVSSDDIVYEVGAGKGNLTYELCGVSKFVISFELDSSLFAYCKHNICSNNLNLIHGDGLNDKLDIPFDIFMSNLPYYESRRAIAWLSQKNFRKGVIMLQKEFVDKLLSDPGDKNYRAISVLCQYRFSINILMDIPKKSFHPMPKIDSQLIEIYPKNPPLSKSIIDDIQFLFSFRKKTISFILNYFHKHYRCNIDPMKYSEIKSSKLATLSPSKILTLIFDLGDDVGKPDTFTKCYG